MTDTLIRTDEEIRAWFGARIPEGWFADAPEVKADREEILVVGSIPEPEHEKGASKEAKQAARLARIRRFREETRDRRIGIALEAEDLYRRKVSWGAECGGVRRLFTTLSGPVMTRLRMGGRSVLDTLVEAGVARSRSEALAWCVKLVGENQEKWLKDLRKAYREVEKVRAAGPTFEA